MTLFRRRGRGRTQVTAPRFSTLLATRKKIVQQEEQQQQTQLPSKSDIAPVSAYQQHLMSEGITRMRFL